MIREFNAEEDRIVTELQRDCSVGQWLIPVGFRAGLLAGVKRALDAAEAVPSQERIAAIRKLIEE